MRRRLLLIAAVALGLVICGFVLWSKHKYLDPYRPIDESEYAGLVDAAERGDVDSGWRLYLFHSFVDYSPEKMERWLLVGANNGDVRSIYSLAFFYVSEDVNVIDFEKAEYWADVLAKYDNVKAAEIKNEIERVKGVRGSKRP